MKRKEERPANYNGLFWTQTEQTDLVEPVEPTYRRGIIDDPKTGVKFGCQNKHEVTLNEGLIESLSQPAAIERLQTNVMT